MLSGEVLYSFYAESAALLPEEIRRNEVLPAWSFLPEAQRKLWNRVARQIEAFLS